MADERQQGQEENAQEVQEDKKRLYFSERIRPSIPPEQLWLHDLSYADKEKFATLTPEQQKEWTEFQRESFKRLPETIEKIKKSILQMMNILTEHNRETWKAITSYLSEEIGEWSGKLQKLEKLERLEDFIVEELKMPEYDGLELADLIDDLSGESEEPIPGDLWERIIDGAENRKIASQLPTTNIKRPDAVEYPIDKIDANVWNMLATDASGQIKFAIPVQRSGADKIIPVYYSINFDSLENNVRITKHLTQLDKRIYIAINALKAAGNDTMTTTQIHYAMGFTKRPNSEQLEKYREEIIKMIGAVVFLDNKDEANEYNYPRFEYFGSLLPAKGISSIVNGKITENAIKIIDELPLIQYAKQHKQITTIDIKYLQSPFNKTENNLRIEDYMIERISRARSGNQPQKILKKKLFEKIEANDPKKKARALKTVETLMQFYKDSGFVVAYTMDDSSISFSF